MYSFILYILCVSACFQYGSAQIQNVDLNVHNLLQMQEGLGWPHSLHVAEGLEALLKLVNSPTNPTICQVTTPSGQVFDVRSPPNNRYERWSDECGLRIRNVVKSDEGRWRLTAGTTSDNITGWTEVYVEEYQESYTAPPISLLDGQTDASLELTTLENSYCVVEQPFSESSLVPGHCRVTLERTSRAVQGNWNILVGLPGRVEELHMERHVAVEAERLDVGYIYDSTTNKLNLYCNILHTAKNITFCRFHKTSSSSGYNVMDGLSDGTHSYYGNGFKYRQCGMTIEMPTAQDYGTWRCSVGVKQWVGNTVQEQTPMQALISVAQSNPNSRVFKYPRSEDGEVISVMVQEDKSYTLMCRAQVSLTYCWFQHPNGTQFTPVPLANEQQLFWYTGESLQAGDCGITFTHAYLQDAGEWKCHMGPRNQLGVEITDRINVRVTGPLAASEKEVRVTVGGETTLYCHTSNSNRPLEYCRFLTPDFVGISVDSSVTHENAILNRFYFTPGRDLDHGDCSLTINPVRSEDLGEWTCAALVDDDIMESRDTIQVYRDESSPRYQAGIVGMSVGLSVLVVALAGVLWYKREKIIAWRNRSSSQNDPVVRYDSQYDTASFGTGSITSEESISGRP